jgi:hypothetical protein
MASSDRAPAEVRWRIVPSEPPRALRPCAGCGGIQPFVSSGRFRVNAQKRRLDVWLIYRCAHCDKTWNLEILARTRPEQIDPSLLSQLLANDPDTARRHACDLGRLARAGARTLPAPGFRVERPDGVWPGPHEGGPPVRIDLEAPCELRLDRLLAVEFGVSRAALDRLFETGRLHIEPGGVNALRRPLRSSLRVLG